MNIFDIDYNKKEKNLFKYHYTCLLSELLILNYEFSNHEYNGTTGQDAFYKLQKKIKYGMELIYFKKMEFVIEYCSDDRIAVREYELV